MSVRKQGIGEVPEETAEVAQAIYPKGNLYLTIRDKLGDIYQDEDLKELYSERGQSAESPWRLAWVTVLQFMENLTDRQAAEAVRSRIDWKYRLGLPLRDRGFHYSVLCEFRQRLVAGDASEILLTKFLEGCRSHGWLKERGRQRTDGTHILARIRNLNRLELVGTTLQWVLNRIAEEAPLWLKAQVSADWYERYGRPFESYHLPKEESQRQALMQQIGSDGLYLLNQLFAGQDVPDDLWSLPEVQTLRHIWVQEFYQQDGQTYARDNKQMPPSSLRCHSPYDLEARYATKGGLHWTGYKLHLTETCDDDLPHLLVHVETVPAPQHDSKSTARVHDALAQKDLLPKEHLMDGAYSDALLRSTSQQVYGIEIVSPARESPSWQTNTPGAFGPDAFVLDETSQTLTCPAGHRSHPAVPTQNKAGLSLLNYTFRLGHCSKCLLKPRCTRNPQRTVHLHADVLSKVLLHARQYPKTDEFKERYKTRAGVEGTISQAVGPFHLRATRYLGLHKTHLQHVATATAINLSRLFHWLVGRPLAKTRTMPFVRLALMT